MLELCEVHDAIPALPATFQFIKAVGALAPTGAVKVAVKVRVEPSVAPPVPAKVSVGVTFAIVKLCELALAGAL